MEFRLPEEVWSSKVVKFSHLKVFDCISYAHINSDACSKRDTKSKICLFIYLLTIVMRPLATDFGMNIIGISS